MPTPLQLEKAQKTNELTEIFEKSKLANGSYDFSLAGTTVEAVRDRNNELTEISKKRASEEEIEAMAENTARQNAALMEPNRKFGFGNAADKGDGSDRASEQFRQAKQKSLGDAFIESPSYKGYERRATGQMMAAEFPGVGVKATFGTSDSTFTQYDRQPGIVMVEQQMLTVADLFAQGETTQNTIRYVREDSYTNAATTVAEGGTKPEASWDTSEVDAPVRKIAVTSKVTDEMFADFPMIRDYINQRMPFMVRQTEEAQLLSGNGSSPNLTGVLNVSGIQTQATGADNNPDAIYKAMTKVRTVGYFEPDAAVINPLNWTPIRLMKTSTGEYIWGAPSEVGPERIWGLRVDVTTNITANTALIGAFKLGGQVFYREGIRIEATNTNSDDFVKNLITIRCEQREALAIYRPLAFCTVTGLAQ